MPRLPSPSLRSLTEMAFSPALSLSLLLLPLPSTSLAEQDSVLWCAWVWPAAAAVADCRWNAGISLRGFHSAARLGKVTLVSSGNKLIRSLLSFIFLTCSHTPIIPSHSLPRRKKRGAVRSNSFNSGFFVCLAFFVSAVLFARVCLPKTDWRRGESKLGITWLRGRFHAFPPPIVPQHRPHGLATLHWQSLSLPLSFFSLAPISFAQMTELRIEAAPPAVIGNWVNRECHRDRH